MHEHEDDNQGNIAERKSHASYNLSTLVEYNLQPCLIKRKPRRADKAKNSAGHPGPSHYSHHPRLLLSTHFLEDMSTSASCCVTMVRCPGTATWQTIHVYMAFKVLGVRLGHHGSLPPLRAATSYAHVRLKTLRMCLPKRQQNVRFHAHHLGLASSLSQPTGRPMTFVVAGAYRTAYCTCLRRRLSAQNSTAR